MTVRVYEVVRFESGLRCDLDAVEKSGLLDGTTVECGICRDAQSVERWAVISDGGDIQISCSACLSLTLERMRV